MANEAFLKHDKYDIEKEKANNMIYPRVKMVNVEDASLPEQEFTIDFSIKAKQTPDVIEFGLHNLYSTFKMPKACAKYSFKVPETLTYRINYLRPKIFNLEDFFSHGISESASTAVSGEEGFMQSSQNGEVVEGKVSEEVEVIRMLNFTDFMTPTGDVVDFIRYEPSPKADLYVGTVDDGLVGTHSVFLQQCLPFAVSEEVSVDGLVEIMVDVEI